MASWNLAADETRFNSNPSIYLRSLFLCNINATSDGSRFRKRVFGEINGIQNMLLLLIELVVARILSNEKDSKY